MQKKRVLSLRNFLIILGISFQFAVLFSLVQAKYVSLIEKGEVGMDFLSYYSAGYIIHYDSPTNMYNLELQRKVQEPVLNKTEYQNWTIYFFHPPILAPILEQAITNNMIESYFRWTLILILFQLSSLGLLTKLLNFLKWKKRDIFLIVLSGCSSTQLIWVLFEDKTQASYYWGYVFGFLD